MESRIVFLVVLLAAVLAISYAYPYPGGSVHHERVRIHVPTHFKTIYKTHVIKVPEHHHHIKEKIKEVPKYIPVPVKKHEHHEHHEHHDLSSFGEGGIGGGIGGGGIGGGEY